MNPAKVRRDRLQNLTDLPNIGPSLAADLQQLGIHTPQQLIGKDALAMYWQLCRVTGSRHDPCVLDVFMSITRFMEGDPAQTWWAYTRERKMRYGEALAGDTPAQLG